MLAISLKLPDQTQGPILKYICITNRYRKKKSHQIGIRMQQGYFIPIVPIISHGYALEVLKTCSYMTCFAYLLLSATTS